MNAEFDGKMKECREITVDELNAASFAVRLRNGIARLFIPLL